MKFIKTNGGRARYWSCRLKKDQAGDCVIRAIALATEQDYKLVWDTLFKLAQPMGFLPNDDKVYGIYLKSLGWTKQKTLKNSKNRKYKVKNFPTEYGKAYIMNTTCHITTIINKVHYDSWNCGEWCANSYWIKKVN